MIIFDVRCKVLKPISYTGKDGRKVEIAPGVYRLRGLDHLVRSAGQATTAGTDLAIVSTVDGTSESFDISPAELAQHLARDDAEITP